MHKPATSAAAPTEEEIRWAKKLLRHRKELTELSEAAEQQKPRLFPAADEVMEEGDEVEAAEVLSLLGLERQATPATGNCQFFALAEAGLQQTFTAQDDVSKLVKWTTTIRKGIQAATMINFQTEFPAYTCRSLLETVGRALPSEDEDDVVGEAQEYFKQVANGSSDPEDLVAFQAWGGGETLSMVVKAVQRKVFLVSARDSKTFYTVYRPAIKKLEGRQVATSIELNLSVTEWMSELRQAREEMAAGRNLVPIVLNLDQRHYSSLLFK